MTTASIVTYHNPYDMVAAAATSALESGVETLFIVDHSSDNQLETLTQLSPRIEYIRHENTGYGAGHNVAIRRAMEHGAKYHVVINPDISFNANVLPDITTYMDAHIDVGMIMPEIRYPDGRLQHHCKMVPTPFDLIARRFLPKRLTVKKQQRFELRFTGYDRIMNIPYLCGCFMVLQCDALRTTGLFDERFFMYPEDIDLTRRMHEHYLTLYYPEVTVTHAYAAASRTNLRMLIIHAVNMVRYFNKWGWLHDRKRRAINRHLLMSLKDGSISLPEF
ncbi:MAG: glycosyltransferase family 2 protein [Muribaculaceae bacterium]|nr:glycosyltransferase family 2 protein [Muribaculaceae bacterium]